MPSAKSRILTLLKERHPSLVPRDEIREVANVSEWARRLRELSEEGWDIETMPDGYRLRSLEQQECTNIRRNIDARTRYRILHRDHSRCRRCGRGTDDDVKLTVDHVIPVAWGGHTDDENLWTLCEECNLGKKAWESDADAGAMKAVLEQTSARGRILEYLRFKVGQLVTKSELQIVSGISEYARRIRELRAEGWDIVSHYEDHSIRPGDYMLRKDRKR